MNENLTAVDAVQESGEGSQTSEQNQVQEQSVENSVVAEQKPVQDKDTNSAFAELRKKAESEAAKAKQYEEDLQYAKQYGQYGIYSKADYEKAMAAQEAQNAGVDPEFYNTVQSLVEKVSHYERKDTLSQQEQKLENDPKAGELYKSMKDDVHKYAEQYDVDYDTAFTFLLRQNIDKFKPDVQKLKDEAVKEYLEKVKSGQKPIEGSGSGPATVVSTPKTFDEAKKASLEYMKKIKQ